MIDREQAIEAAMSVSATAWQGDEQMAAEVVDGILALPDPVHEFAEWVASHKEVPGVYSDAQHQYMEWITPEGEYDADLNEVVMRARAALSDERVPVKGRCSECHSATDRLPCPVCVLARIHREQTVADALLAHERRTGVRARLRAALADERVPVPITDEMTLRAHRELMYLAVGPEHTLEVRAALDAALNGGKR